MIMGATRIAVTIYLPGFTCYTVYVFHLNFHNSPLRYLFIPISQTGKLNNKEFKRFADVNRAK